MENVSGKSGLCPAILHNSVGPTTLFPYFPKGMAPTPFPADALPGRALGLDYGRRNPAKNPSRIRADTRIDFRITGGQGRGVKTELSACHRCGQPSATELAGEAWCEGCLHVAAACCGCWEGDGERLERTIPNVPSDAPS